MQTVDKFQRILDLITRPGSTGSAASSSSHRQVRIDPVAAAILRDYVEEVAHAVVEEAAVLCKHRKGTLIDAKDINLILAKKLDLHVPGSPRPTVNDKHSLKLHRLDGIYPAEEESASAADTPAPAFAPSSARAGADNKDIKEEKPGLSGSAASGTASGAAAGGAAGDATASAPAPKRKGAKRKQQDTASGSDAASKQPKL